MTHQLVDNLIVHLVTAFDTSLFYSSELKTFVISNGAELVPKKWLQINISIVVVTRGNQQTGFEIILLHLICLNNIMQLVIGVNQTILELPQYLLFEIN